MQCCQVVTIFMKVLTQGSFSTKSLFHFWRTCTVLPCAVCPYQSSRFVLTNSFGATRQNVYEYDKDFNAQTKCALRPGSVLQVWAVQFPCWGCQSGSLVTDLQCVNSPCFRTSQVSVRICAGFLLGNMSTPHHSNRVYAESWTRNALQIALLLEYQMKNNSGNRRYGHWTMKESVATRAVREDSCPAGPQKKGKHINPPPSMAGTMIRATT